MQEHSEKVALLVVMMLKKASPLPWKFWLRGAVLLNKDQEEENLVPKDERDLLLPVLHRSRRLWTPVNRTMQDI